MQAEILARMTTYYRGTGNSDGTAFGRTGHRPAAPPVGPVTVGGSLLRKYVAYLVALVSTALLVSGLVGLYFTYEESKTARLNLQRAYAEGAATRIQTYLNDIVDQLGWVRMSQVDPASPTQRQIEYRRLLRQVEEITHARMLDQTGRERLRVSRLNPDVLNSFADFSQSPVFLKPREKAPYYGPVDFHKDTEPYVTIAVGGGDPLEITAVDLNLTFIHKVIAAIKIGKKGFAYVVDSNGQLIAHPDVSFVRRKNDFSGLAHVKAVLVGEAEPATMAKNVDGREALIAHAAIAPLGWHVFVEQPLAEAFAPLYGSLLHTGLLLLAGLVLAVGVSVFLARRMVTPIRTIQAGASRIAAGKLDQRLDVRTGDELQALANEFNVMARQLKESYADLERKVEERTRDLAETLEQQTATNDVLKKISRSSFDLDVVLEELIKCVVQLGRADAGGLYLRHTDSAYVLRTAHSANPQLQSLMSTMTAEIDPDSNTAAGRAVRSRQPAQIDDVQSEPGYRWPDAGFRTALAVPILREGSPIGVIVVLNVLKQPFSEKQIGVITTFADQAGIAIQNVRLFNETQNKTRQLELANRHKSEFLANVSHELRTPLNAIIGFSEVLRERMFGDINEKQAEYLEDIHSSGKHLLSLINDILNLSKIEAGRMDLELACFDVAEALQSALSVVRERASQKHIALALELDAGVGDWVADERKFKQIMLNLLSNAVKFTREGGKVTVRAARAPAGLRISVADTGVGIAAQYLEVIFDEFSQVGSDKSGKEEGTGLGLPLTRRFVELHGGTIEVRSTVDEGSVFTFVLPPKTLEVA